MHFKIDNARYISSIFQNIVFIIPMLQQYEYFYSLFIIFSFYQEIFNLFLNFHYESNNNYYVKLWINRCDRS